MKKRLAVSESKSKLKEFFKKLSWWKKIVLLVLIIAVVMVILCFFNKPSSVSEPYHMKDGLCYSDFLENCEGKKVEVTGTIVKYLCCIKAECEAEAYTLCNVNIPPCDLKPRTYFWEDEPYQLDCFQNDCLSLVQPCWTEDAYKKINNNVESLLPNPINKTVKVVGNIFVVKPSPLSQLGERHVGVIPDGITIIRDES